VRISTPLDTIIAIVRGDAPPWPEPRGPAPARALLEVARDHGVHLLIARRLRGPAFSLWPDAVRAQFDRDLRLAVVVEEARRAEIERILEALARAGASPLLFKGTPLAYTHYPDPWLRPRVDVDVLVAEADRGIATRALEARGYARAPLVDGGLVMRQAEFVKILPSGLQHTIDLHWRIGNPHAVADLLSFEELQARAMPVPALGPSARALGAEHALLVAAVHHVAHHVTGPRLIWRYDVHLLASAMNADVLRSWARRAVELRAGRVCEHELSRAREIFGTRLAVAESDLGSIFAAADRDEPSAQYLTRPGSRASRLLGELRLLPTWRARAQLLGQHLFPSPTYMRQRYGRSHPLILPALYAHRIVTGIRAWFRPPTESSE
jgi:hypothetical protein